MIRKLLPLIVMILPAAAQLDSGGFIKLVDAGDDKALAAAIRDQCIDFEITAVELKPIIGKADVLLALFECLQGTVKEKTAELAIAVAAESTSEGAVAAAPLAGPQAAQKAEGILRTLMLLPSLRNETERDQAKYENRRLLTQIIRDNVASIEDGQMQAWRDAGIDVPAWLPPLVDGARAATNGSYPTLSLDIARRTDFYGSIDERGIKVFMSLFMVEHTPDEVEKFDFEDALIYPHIEFPYTYNTETGEIDLHRLKNTEVTRMRLQKALEDYESLDLIPGKWGIRIQAYTGFDRIRADYSHYFDVEANTDYTMAIEWKTGGDGIKRLQFNVEKR